MVNFVTMLNRMTIVIFIRKAVCINSLSVEMEISISVTRTHCEGAHPNPTPGFRDHILCLESFYSSHFMLKTEAVIINAPIQ